MKIIGLTGVIGSGKTTVAGFLKELGAVVIDADEIAHEVYAPGTPGWREVKTIFGKKILARDDTVDRRKLGDIVFNDPAARSRLENIIHPLVEQRIRCLLDGYRWQGKKLAVVEATLLIEAGWVPLLDELWVTTAPREIIYRRLSARDNTSRQQVLARLHAQLPVYEQRRLATRVIKTDSGLDELRRRVEGLWQGATCLP